MQYFGFDRPSFGFKTYGFGSNPDAAILALFAGGKQGVFYDPSDLTTLFQDAKGTTPVTQDGDPVGLILDKSKGLELGTNKITNGDFSQGLANWSLNGGDEATVVNGVFTPTDVVRYSNNITLEVGKTYLIETDIDNSSASSINNKLRLSAHDNNSFSSHNNLGSSYTGRLIISGHKYTDVIIYLFSQNSTATTVSNITVRELKGNHARQTESASRPIYKTDGILHWLYFDGVDDYMVNNTLYLTQPFNASIAQRDLDPKSLRNFFDSTNASKRAVLWAIQSYGIYAGVDAYSSISRSDQTDVLTVSFSHDNSSLRTSNGVSNGLKPGGSDMDGLTLSARVGGTSSTAKTRFYGFVASKEQHSVEVRNYLAAKAGVTL